MVSEQKRIEILSIEENSNTSLYLTPQRPANGSQGARVDLFANFFKINGIRNAQSLHLYTIDVSGVGEQPKGKKLQQIIKIMLDTEPFFYNRRENFATDFTQFLLSTIRLDGELPGTFVIQWRKEFEDPPGPFPPPQIYHIKTEPHILGFANIRQVLNTLVTKGVPVSQLDFADQPTMMQALNIIANHYGKYSYQIVKVGRNKSFSFDSSIPYDPEVPLYKPVSRVLEARRGYFCSVRVAKGDILLNVNPTVSLFHLTKAPKGGPMTLSTLIAIQSEERGVKNFDSKEDRTWLYELVKGMRVRRADLQIRFNQAGQEIPDARVVFGLADPRNKDRQRETCRLFGSLAKDTYFWRQEDGTRTTVAEKYKAFFNGETMNQPVVNLGNKENPDYFLTSMCIVLPGNVSRANLIDKVQQKAMIDFAAMKPHSAKYAIEQKALHTLGLDCSATHQSIPIAVDSKMITLVGRRLPVPPVKCQTPVHKQETTYGSWTMQGLKLHKAMKLENWIVVRFQISNQKTENDLKRTVENFLKELALNGMSSEPPKGYRTATIQNPDDPQIGTFLKKISEIGYNFALIVLPKDDKKFYARIKTAGDLHGGFHTVCVVESKFMGKDYNDKQYFSNVSLKVNLKLGGTNQIAEDKDLPVLSEGNIMIVGYDVTHPPPFPRTNSSVDGKSNVGKKPAAASKNPSKTKPASRPTNLSASKSAKPEPKYNSAGLRVSNDLESAGRSIAAMVASIDKDLAQFPAVTRMQELAGQEMVICLQDMFGTCLDRWAKNHGGKFPTCIIIYRDGVSESQYKTVLVEEWPLLQAACLKRYGKNLPKVTLMVVGK